MLYLYFFFFFKQKTAYEMRISDWSSDVCSSDLYISGKEHYENDKYGVYRVMSVIARFLAHLEYFQHHPEGVEPSESPFPKIPDCSQFRDDRPFPEANISKPSRRSLARGRTRDRKSAV